MKYTTPISSLVIILFAAFYSCEPGVVFHESSPPSVEAIQSIPDSYQGIYLCESDSTLIEISHRSIVAITHHHLVTSLDKISQSEHCALVDGGLHLSDSGECFPFEWVGEDSISAVIYYQDTIFSFSPEEVVKSYNGVLFLNVKTERDDWSTWLLKSIESGELEFSQVEIPMNEEVIKELAKDYKERPLKDDKVQYVIRPTLVEFEKIMEKDYTTLCDILIPINIEDQYFEEEWNL